jgi:hypothetical protein
MESDWHRREWEPRVIDDETGSAPVPDPWEGEAAPAVRGYGTRFLLSALLPVPVIAALSPVASSQVDLEMRAIAAGIGAVATWFLLTSGGIPGRAVIRRDAWSDPKLKKHATRVGGCRGLHHPAVDGALRRGRARLCATGA